jgi:hypothetical protein
VKRELERVDVPGEHDARKRTWPVVAAAFTERSPVPRPSHWPRVAAVALSVSALVAATVSSPGRAVLDEIREVVGVERAQPALFSLPTQGRLLVASDAGVWVVQQDGSRRLLGDYREATWSPFGRYVAATGMNELAALEPDGDVRWTLARASARSPRWTGSEADTRVAYVSGRRARVVAGDGTNDRAVCRGAVHFRRVPPAWQPGPRFALALVAPSRAVHVYEVGGCTPLWRSSPIRGPQRLEWSGDGTRLLVVTHEGVRILRAGTGSLAGVERANDAAFRPNSRELALIRKRGDTSELLIGSRVVFRGAGELQGLTWSPDGRWVRVGWPAADQWVFVRADGKRIRAVSNVSEQFRSRSFPRVEGWCCTG